MKPWQELVVKLSQHVVLEVDSCYMVRHWLLQVIPKCLGMDVGQFDVVLDLNNFQRMKIMESKCLNALKPGHVVDDEFLEAMKSMECMVREHQNRIVSHIKELQTGSCIEEGCGGDVVNGISGDTQFY